MAKIIAGIIFIALVWFIVSSGGDKIIKDQYVRTLFCAAITGDQATEKELVRLHELILKDGRDINKSDMEAASIHWQVMFDVDSLAELIASPKFQISCHHDACLLEGHNRKQCSEDLIDACFQYNLSKKECLDL
ncbi:hypothetical protein L3V31_12685 [Vibrio sp. J1-1]|uniref:hypothetical protein n=1 Tax=Vibrio sp. J1-1 TaxID=2912251 RepID=UPI001F34A743|nr:hypothetical protein [Vibrio sp. J1-1]MCF7482584.1 hypothetical protein [Vibrio sp. J1-1]